MITSLTPEFVEYIPEELKDGILYISLKYEIAIHKCCCGVCGRETVTAIQQGWKILIEGDLVSIQPSIGNWQFPCKSHYWITQNKVVWA